MLNRKDFKTLCIFASIFICLSAFAEEKQKTPPQSPPQIDPYKDAIHSQIIRVPRELATEVPEVVSIRYNGIDGFPRKINGKEMRWRACSGVIFSKGQQSCVLTAGHCMGGILGMGKYTERATDEVLKSISFENAQGKKAKIDASDLSKNVKILNAVPPPMSDKTAKDIIDSEIARVNAAGKDLAIVKLDTALKGFGLDDIVPKTSPLKNEFEWVKGFLIGGGTLVSSKEFFKSRWPVRNQFEQRLHYCKQTYVGEVSEMSLQAQYSDFVGAEPSEVEKVFANEMQRFHAELIKNKPGVAHLISDVQEMGYGDGGAPFFMLDKNKKKKIYGIATASNTERLYTEMVSITGDTQRAWISEQLKEMGCN